MPELPDLTIYAENLKKAVAGKKINRIIYYKRGRLNVTQEALAKALTGASLTVVRRAGKQICFDTSNGTVLRVHLMLTGGFVLTGAGELDRLDAPVLAICFSDGTALAVTDPKGWATLALNPKAEAEAPDALELGPDDLQQILNKKPKAMIKSLLLDQNLVGGIGNAYADEILWQSRISPKSIAGKLPPEAVAALGEAIPAVLKDAVEQLRKRHPGMVAGEYREFLKVHGPALKVSPTGAPIIKENLLSKRTYYTAEQRLYK